MYLQHPIDNPGLPEFIANNKLFISGDAWIWICEKQIVENEDKTKADSGAPVSRQQ